MEGGREEWVTALIKYLRWFVYNLYTRNIQTFSKVYPMYTWCIHQIYKQVLSHMLMYTQQLWYVYIKYTTASLLNSCTIWSTWCILFVHRFTLTIRKCFSNKSEFYMQHLNYLHDHHNDYNCHGQTVKFLRSITCIIIVY